MQEQLTISSGLVLRTKRRGSNRYSVAALMKLGRSYKFNLHNAFRLFEQLYVVDDVVMMDTIVVLLGIRGICFPECWSSPCPLEGRRV